MRILTISDIHFKTEYEDNDKVRRYFESFTKKIDELHEKFPIDLLVISGDLTFSGESEQYKVMSKILRSLLPDNIPIYSIVGNHDVNWSALKDAIGNSKNLEDLFTLKDEDISMDLNSSSSKFKRVFNEFRINFYEDINKGIDSKFVLKFCNKHYAGYLWNSDEKVLLLFLNSSWFSFGPGVIKSYYEEKVDRLKVDDLKTLLFFLLSDKLSQEGKQSYFFSTFPYYDEINLIIKDPEVKVLTFAHHPPSWLKWEEQFTNNENKRYLNDILSLSNLLITGHLHTPVKNPSLLNNKCYHFANGAFLDYHFLDTQESTVNPVSLFPNNWFTILDIESNSFSYESYKFNTIKKASRVVEYDYVWELENQNSEFSFDVTMENEWDFSPRMRPTDKKEFKFNIKDYEFKPKDLNKVKQLLEDKRSNVFTLIHKKAYKIENDAVNVMKFNKDDYLIVINNLELMHKVLIKAKTFEELEQNPLFNSLIVKLNNYSNEKLPILAFYDFLKPIDKRYETYFAKYMNERFILFQSFKHYFFVKFPKLFIFTELNIVYDIIME